jgi:gamma-glutamylputrescine oxidase
MAMPGSTRWTAHHRRADRHARDYHAGGEIDHGAGHIHPLNFALGLAAAAEAAGAVIHERSEVRRWTMAPPPACAPRKAR